MNSAQEISELKKTVSVLTEVVKDLVQGNSKSYEKLSTIGQTEGDDYITGQKTLGPYTFFELNPRARSSDIQFIEGDYYYTPLLPQGHAYFRYIDGKKRLFSPCSGIPSCITYGYKGMITTYHDQNGELHCDDDNTPAYSDPLKTIYFNHGKVAIRLDKPSIIERREVVGTTKVKERRTYFYTNNIKKIEAVYDDESTYYAWFKDDKLHRINPEGNTVDRNYPAVTYPCNSYEVYVHDTKIESYSSITTNTDYKELFNELFVYRIDGVRGFMVEKDVQTVNKLVDNSSLQK